MKHIFLTSLIIASFVLSTHVAYSCSCEPPSQKKVFGWSSAVFYGEVVDIWESDVPLFDDQPKVGSYAVKFKVIEYWKGVKGSETIVHSDLGGLSCHQFAFTKGKRYLVYAEGKNLIAITGCTRSSPDNSDYFAAEYRGLGKSKKPKTKVE
jgi:hypothetical protein